MVWHWQDVKQTKNNSKKNWKWQPVNIPTMSVLDDDSGNLYSVPVTFDEQDIRFAIATQEQKEPKNNFFGKLKMYGADAWNMATAVSDTMEESLNSTTRGALGMTSETLDNLLFWAYDVKGLEKRAEQLSNYNPLKYKNVGLFSPPENWFLNNLTEEERLAKLQKTQNMLEKVNKLRQRVRNAFDKGEEIIRPTAEMDKTDQLFENIGSSATSLATSAATLLATKNPTVAAAIVATVFGSMRNKEVFEKSYAKGMDWETADKYGQIAGAIEGGVELVMEPVYYAAANWRPVKKLTDSLINRALRRSFSQQSGKSAVKKIASKHSQSVLKSALKGFATEGAEEGLQQFLGMTFDNSVGLENYHLNEILGETFMSMAVGGLVGSGGAIVGTSSYNRRVRQNNERIKNVVKKEYPDLNEAETQNIADALQEVFYQEESKYVDEFDNLLNKEADPDTLDQGLSKENLTHQTRELLKNKYEMSDEEIDKTIDVALTSIDIRNQFNEAYNELYEQMVKAGAKPLAADSAGRIAAARASAIAMNEKISVRDVLKRWNLRFDESESGVVNWQKDEETKALIKSRKQEISSIVDGLKKRTGKDFKDSRISLLPFLRAHGGLQDSGGELKNMDAGKLYVGLVNKNGMNLDDATMMAWENGYLKGAERPDINALLEAVDTELRGTKIYAGDEATESIKQNEALDSWERYFDEAGVDINSDDVNTIYDKLEDYKKRQKETKLVLQNNLSEADIERLAIMQENGLDRVQALEQLAKEKQAERTTEEFLNDTLPFYQDGFVAFVGNPAPFYQDNLHSDSHIVKISGKEFGEYTGDKKAYEKAFIDYYKKNIGGTSVVSPVLGEVKFFNSAIDETQHWNRATPENLKYIAAVPEIIRTSSNVVEEQVKHPKKNIIAAWRVTSNVNADGDVRNVSVIILEDSQHNRYYTFDARQKIAPANTAVNGQVEGAQTDNSVYNDSITSTKENVNKTFDQSDPGGMVGHRGQYDAGNRIITLFANADPSTIIHETAHFFLDDMRRFADNAETAEQLDAIYKYVGSLDGQISREQHEYFARSFEAYLMEGKAPNNLLAAAFRKFRNWLGHIYRNIKNLNVDLDDNIRKTFDDMLGSKKLDFAINFSSKAMRENIKSGYIPQSTINKALRLLDEGKMSKADMENMIDKLKTGELKRNDVGKYLYPFSKSNHINNEQIFYYDRMRYRQQLEHGNVTKADVKKKIDRLLEWSKPRSQNGKLVGRFTDIKVNRFFDNALKNLALEKNVALEKIAENMKLIDAITKGEETGNIADLTWQNKLLSIPAGRANITLMGDVYNALSDTYNAGRVTNAVTGEVKKAYRQRLVNEAIGVLDQGAGKNWRKDSSPLMKALRRTGLNSVAWNGVLDILSMFDKTSQSGQSKLNQRLNVFAEEKKMRMGVYNDGETVSRLIGDALAGNKNAAISVSRYVNKKLNEEFTIEWGGNARKFTKDQLLDIYMKAKDPGTRKIMLEDKVLQFDEEFLVRVDEQITDDDKAVADALFEFYREDYEKLNEFYEQHYGISLGKSEFYSPRSMDRGGINVDTGDLRSYAGLSAIKQRRAKAGQIKPKGAFEVLQNHINNVNHYIAFADKLQDINAVLGNPEIKNRIRNLFGEEMNKKISREVARFASNDKLFAADGVNKIMSKLRANYAVSVLGVKPALAIKQLTSFPAYLEHLSVKEFMEGIIDFAKHPKQAIEILSSSELMKTRQTNIIKDFEVVSKSEWIKNLGTKNGFREFLMLNIQLGDRGAIYLGGWPVYKAYLKKTGSHEKAIAEFERITNETQQSSYMSEQSKWQSNPFLNWFTMFQSSQNQYFRKELTALRGLITSRMPKDKVFKTLFIFHFLLPMLFQFVSDGFRWDKTAQLRAGILGSLNGVFVLGKVMERLVDWGIDGKLNYKLGIRELLPPISVFENIGRFLDKSVKYATNDIALEDYVEALKGGVRTLGEMTGLPLKYPMDVTTTYADYAKDEEYAKLGLLMLGWSPWALRDFEE